MVKCKQIRAEESADGATQIFKADIPCSHIFIQPYITFLETGVLPIKYEIHIRQLGFLHHILTLNENDPVKHAYQQQLKYSMASNWANEVIQIRNSYSIVEEDTEVAKLSQRRWKKI